MKTVLNRTSIQVGLLKNSVYPAYSLLKQVGLKGHILLLRKITINPGGQIGKHSADKTSTVVYVASVTWNEGRESGEIEHTAGDSFVEYYDTVH